MRAPSFWWRPQPSALARLLQPVSRLYGSIAARRLSQAGERAAVPVICIGNFTAGGAGKTPTALKVAALLAQAGERPAFLTRGYGGRLPGPLIVADHDAAEVGDEPLLLARSAPTIVSRDRPAGARLAVERTGAGIIVMDDGFQNPSLAKDLSLIVVDGATGFGNGLALPAGPLRAPLAAQWPHAHALLVIGAGAPGERAASEARRLAKPVFTARLEPDAASAASLRGRKVLAFAGIGRPEKFFETLRALGADVRATRAYPDHAPYAPDEITALKAQAADAGLALATTEKDAVRLGPLAEGMAVLPVRLALDDEAGFRALLMRR